MRKQWVTVDLDEAQALLSYDPETGLFTRRVTIGNKSKAGTIAGAVCDKWGYRIISLRARRIRASRLAWAFMTGEFPDRLIDHKNRDRADDRWCNLRLSTSSQNGANMSMNWGNKAGLKGVTMQPCGRFAARIQVRGKPKYLGRYETPEEAHEVYLEEAEKGFGEYATAGYIF